MWAALELPSLADLVQAGLELKERISNSISAFTFHLTLRSIVFATAALLVVWCGTFGRQVFMSRTTYRVRVAIFWASWLFVLMQFAGLATLNLLYLVVALWLVTYYVLRHAVTSRVVVEIGESVEVDATRNEVDANFIAASDRYVTAYVEFGGNGHNLECANLGLAKRVAAGVSQYDPQAISMLIAKDRCSGSETLRIRSDPDTFWLACALVLQRLDRVREGSRDADAHRARLWVEGSFIKRTDFSGLLLCLTGLFSAPAALLGVVLRQVFLGQPNKRKPSLQIAEGLLHAYNLSYRVIKKAARGIVRGYAEFSTKTSRVFQVGPLLRNPHFYKTGPLELLRSLIYRSARAVPDVQAEKLPDFIEYGVRPALAAAFPEGVPFAVPQDMAQAIRDCHFSPGKTKAYMRALERMGDVSGGVMINHTVTAFIKKEFYADYTKEPRTIQCLPIPDRIRALYYLKCLNDAFFANHQINIKHLPAAQRPRQLQNLFGELTTVVSWDCSGFEASVGWEVEGAVWTALVETFHLPRFVRDLVMFSRLKINAQGLRYEGPHSRRSGDYWTSLSNSLVNLALQYYVAHEMGVQVSHCVVEGDDCLVSYSGHISPAAARIAFATMGFQAKEPEVGTGPGSVAFCSTKFDPVTLQPTRDPRNIIDNIGVSFHPAAARDPGFALGMRAASYSCDCPDQPITWVLANIAAEHGVTADDLPWWYSQRAQTEDLTRLHSAPSDEVRQQYADLWDCPVEVQLAIEHCLITGQNFYTVPAILDFRDYGRDDWQTVAEDEAYPDPSRVPLARASYY